MAKPIELETILRGEEARAFHQYMESPDQKFSLETRTIIREARRISRK
jgi:hypothetical protein